ncbi:hypothetical protein F5146DRAFT_252622 [Armillaria mellea]|nr:hypothetical protein F5146DRAFT_252622 [Armillaria mellea]
MFVDGSSFSSTMISFLLSFYLFSDCLTIAWMPSTATTSHQARVSSISCMLSCPSQVTARLKHKTIDYIAYHSNTNVYVTGFKPYATRLGV